MRNTAEIPRTQDTDLAKAESKIYVFHPFCESNKGSVP